MTLPVGLAFDDQPLKLFVDGRACDEPQHFIDSEVEDGSRLIQRPFVCEILSQGAKERSDEPKSACPIKS